MGQYVGVDGPLDLDEIDEINEPPSSPYAYPGCSESDLLGDLDGNGVASNAPSDFTRCHATICGRGEHTPARA